MENIIGDYKSFIKDLLERVTSIGVDIKEYPIDHLCYRTSTVEEYLEMKEKLMKVSVAFVENIHHNRPISKFIFKEPLVCGKYSISLLELPSPKENLNFIHGLEHFEMVVGGDFEIIKEKYKNLWSGTDDSGPYNQPLFITFGDGQTVKFHRHSLNEVLKKEGKEFVKID